MNEYTNNNATVTITLNEYLMLKKLHHLVTEGKSSRICLYDEADLLLYPKNDELEQLSQKIRDKLVSKDTEMSNYYARNRNFQLCYLDVDFELRRIKSKWWYKLFN